MALRRQSRKDFEVIIADDGSREEIVERVKVLMKEQPFPVSHLWQEDNGFRKCIMLNRAVVHSSADYLIFLDGDCVPHHKFVEEHLTYRREHFVFAGRRVDLPADISARMNVEWVSSRRFERQMFRKLMIAGIFRGEKRMENGIRISPRLRALFIKPRNNGILGCNFSMYKADLMLANGFDERYVNPGTGEDTDLEDRLVRLGIKPVVMNHCAIVYHKNHARLDYYNAPNRLLYEENLRNMVGRTPYGIIKDAE